ncbi:MAG TPA: hypothetical protein VKY40_05965, partial [Halanaerobiales bacterium]|nr:hypothetical protein [Halanaerobiales bacterium]
KKIDSPYEFKRSNYWLKIKIWNYMNAIIIGYSSDQSSLVVAGKDRSKKLRSMGKVKPALSKKIGKSLFELLSRLSITKCPLDNKPALSGVIWVKPMIKCQVRYREISKNYTFRHGYVIRLLLEENLNE